MQGRFSIFVINALVEVITGGAGNDSTPPIGIYRSGTKINSFFMGCGIDMQIGSMKSRTDATTDALREAMNREDGDAVIARVITTVADPRQYIAEPKKGEAVIEHLNRALEANGFTVSGGLPTPTSRRRSARTLSAPQASPPIDAQGRYSGGFTRTWLACRAPGSSAVHLLPTL